MATRKPPLKEQSAKSDFSAYIGPTVTGLIQTGTIYDVEKTVALQRPDVIRAVQRFPMVEDLIVTGDNLALARRNIKIPGTLLHHRYEQMLSGMKEETKWT